MLLRFPTELLEDRDLRQQAREDFRWKCRVPVLRQFGAAAEDLGVFVAECAACRSKTARLHPFADLDADLAFAELEAELRTRAGPGYGWRPETCPACGAPSPRPVSALFARHLPEVGHDLQIELTCGAGRVLEMQLALMDRRGVATAIERPQDEVSVPAAFGAPLSLRAFWRAFISAHLYEDGLALHPVQPGYWLGLRPFTDDPRTAKAMFDAFGPWIEALREREGGHDAVCFLADRDEEGIEMPFDDRYEAWLGGFAGDIQQALLEPFVVADSDHFVRALAAEGRRQGLQVVRDSNDETLFVRFRGGALDLRLNLGPVFFRTLHAGFTFHRGLRRFFARELAALAEAARLVPALREMLPRHAIQVHRGQFVEVLDDAGHRCSLADMVRLATTYDVRTDAGRAGLRSAVIPP
ncbi:MAG: hypothetical protein KC620_12605, partial [Myxococcales bacterium]|nr:hypothetical protein [Myxococcales bacterium]